jgi:hypothetical protein
MSTQLQLRKGNTAQTQIFTGAVAEVTVDTDQDTLVVHDGTTVGGHYIVSSAQLSSNVSSLQGVNTTQNTNITSVNQYAASAYNKANTGGTFSGNVTVSQNLNVLGDLVVTGNVTTENVYSFTVVDPLIQLGVGNYTSDLKDIGFASHYNAGTNAHTGLIRDTGTKEYYFFQGYTPILDSNNNVVITDPSFSKANVQADYFKGNLIANTIVVNGVNSLGEKLIINQAYDYGTGRVQITGNTFIVGDVIGSDFHAQGGTNFYRQSTNIANTSIWNYTNSTPIANSSVAPDFTNTGVKIDEGSSNNWHGIETVNSVDKFRNYTHSIYAKPNERNYLFVRFNTGANAHVTFDLANGVYTQEANSDIQWIGMSAAGNGWYRCSTAVNTGDSTSLTILTGPTTTPGLIDDKYQGVNGYGVHVWHPQLEYGRRPSQFTPTANTIAEQENNVVVESGTLIAHQGEIVTLNVGSQTIAGTLQVDGNSNLEDVTATGIITITNIQDSFSNSTGALIVDGGIGVKGNVYFGSHGALLDTPAGIEVRTIQNETVVLRAFNIPFTFNPDGTFQLPSGGDVVDIAGNTVTTLEGVTSRGPTTTNQIGLTGGKNSSNVGTGDLVVSGGVGVSGNVYSGAFYSDNYYTTDKVSLIQPVNQYAQAAYATANGANGLAAGAYNTANGANGLAAGAYGHANNAFNSSNLVNQFAQSAYNTANGANGLAAGAYGHANNAFNSSNLVNQFAQSAYNTANGANGLAAGAYGHANNAFNSSNLVNQFAQSAYNTANGANGLAQGAFEYANTSVTYIAGVDSGQNTTITSVNNFAASAYDTANGANGLAQGAYNTANSALTGASFSGTANSVIATDKTGALYNSNAKFLAANNTLISSNVNVDGTLTVAIKKTSGGVFTSDVSGTPVALDSWPISDFRTVIYNYTVTAAIGYQFHQLVLVQDDFNANLLVTIETVPTGKIASYSASLVDGVVTLYANTQSSATFSYTRDAFLNTGSNILPTDLQFGTASVVDLSVGIVDNPLIDLNTVPV